MTLRKTSWSTFPAIPPAYFNDNKARVRVWSTQHLDDCDTVQMSSFMALMETHLKGLVRQFRLAGRVERPRH